MGLEPRIMGSEVFDAITVSVFLSGMSSRGSWWELEMFLNMNALLSEVEHRDDNVIFPSFFFSFWSCVFYCSLQRVEKIQMEGYKKGNPKKIPLTFLISRVDTTVRLYLPTSDDNRV